MPLAWRVSFDLEIPGRSPSEVRQLGERRGFSLSALRLRVSGDRLRARYVITEAASAPLLKARLVPSTTGTRVQGQVHRAAPVISGAMHTVFWLVFGVGALVAGIATHAWQPVAIGAPLIMTCGWLFIDAVRNLDDEREGYRLAFEQALLEAFARK